MFSVPPFSIQPQIYIGDLSHLTREPELYSILKPYGEISMIKIMRSQSHTSKSFAFVSFKDPSSIAKIRKELNGAKLDGSVIRVCRVTKDIDPQANVFIKNIPANATLQALEDKFDPFGSIVSSKIAFNKDGQSLGYGFVQFENKAQADRAIKEMNGIRWEDFYLVVCEYLPITARNYSSKHNLYIKNFPLSYTQADIKAIFEVFGEVSSCAVASCASSDGQKAFGFVCFKDQESAIKACNEYNGKKQDDFEWYVAPHMNRITRQAYLKDQYQKQIEDWKKRNLYIRNLHPSICENKLRDLFHHYGVITSLKLVKTEQIKYNADGEMSRQSQSKGVGFVCFADELSATKAMQDLQEKMIEGQKVFIAKWKPRKELRASIFKRALLKRNQNPNRLPYQYSHSSLQQFLQPAVHFPSQYPSPSPHLGAVRVAPRYTSEGQMMQPVRRFPMPLMMRPVPLITSREELGEKIYPVVVKYSNEVVAGKITGMIIDLGVPVASRLVQDESKLKEKIFEAIGVLRSAWQQNPSQLRLLPN